MSSGLLAFIGGMGKGYLAQNERNMDRARQDRQDDRLDRQEQRQMRMDAQAKELHDSQMEDINRVKTNREADIKAAQPVEAETSWEQSIKGMTPEQQQELAEKMSTGEVAGTPSYAVAGKSYGPDKAASDAALAKANTPEAAQARRMQTLRATGRGTEADQLDTTLRQGEAADMTLRAGERAEKDAKLKEANDFWNASLEESVRKHGDVHKGITEILTNSELGVAAGKKFHAVKSKDGAWVQYVATGADGKQTNFGTPYKAGPEGSMEALQDAQKVSPDMRMKYRAESLARAAAAEKAKMDAAEHAAKIKLMGAQGLYYSGRGAAAGKAGGDGSSVAPVWNEKADAFLQDNFKSKNVETGAVDFDGGGFEFAQTLALGMSRRNGGNTAAATAYAIKADNALKVLSKGDPVLLNEMRINALNEMRRPVLTPTSQRMTDRKEQELLASKNKK